MENVRKRFQYIFNEKDNGEETIKQQSKLNFNGSQKFNTNYDSYRFKQNEVLMEKPIYLVVTVLELSKMLMYGTYYDNVQP